MAAARQDKQGLDRSGRARIIQIVFSTLLFVAAVFVPAGTLKWVEGWIFIGAFTALVAAVGVYGLRKDPELLNERGRSFERADKHERRFFALMLLLELGMMVVPGLDYRFRWTMVPVSVQVICFGVLIAAALLVLRVLTTNTYAAADVRIQADREQQVVKHGPYRFVRHPMYVGVIAMGLFLPPALGSWWGLIPGGLFALAFIYRTAYEDQKLIGELPGYAAYAQETRYRLLPGVW